jgi:2-desacetyl-2-hydroxyethyl bacteriochlorophyllide A dehydrogenase
MRVCRYQGAGRFVPGAAERPSPGPGEVLLRMRRVGICGTDLHIFQGHLDHRVPRGGIIGHETFGEVAEVGAGAGLTAGDRVVVNPVWSCGRCRACRMGAGHVCYGLKVRGVDLPGGMQEYWAVPAASVLTVPDGLGDDAAAMLEPLAIAVHDVGRAGVQAGQAVLVLGGGPIGALIGLVCRQRGARVAVAEVNPFRLDFLRRLGLTAVGPDQDVGDFVQGWTDGEGVDVAFEVTGNPKAVLRMTEVVRVWGTVSIVAIHAEPMPVNLYHLFAREIVVHGSRLYTSDDWREAIRLAAADEVAVLPFVSRRIPLEALQDGLQEALGGGPVMKVLVDLTA